MHHWDSAGKEKNRRHEHDHHYQKKQGRNSHHDCREKDPLDITIVEKGVHGELLFRVASSLDTFLKDYKLVCRTCSVERTVA